MYNHTYGTHGAAHNIVNIPQACACATWPTKFTEKHHKCLILNLQYHLNKKEIE